MNRSTFLATIVLISSLLALGWVRTFAQPPSDNLPPQDSAEYIEITYQEETIRVPIRDGVPDSVELESKWNLRISPAMETAESGREAAASPEAAKPEASVASSFSSTEILLALAMVVLLAAILIYFLIVEPMRRRRPLTAALKIIERDQRLQFSQAEDLLDQALLAGLRKKDIAQARFALGLLRSLLEKYEEAALVLADLEKSGAVIDRPTAYLMLWVQGRLKQHERVERIYGEYHRLLASFEQSDLIVSISYLALARMRWARREINAAMHYFDQVRELKVLAEEIPTHIDDHEVVMGTVALFEKNHDEAGKHFSAAVEAAKKQNKPTFAGRLGLVLCQWRDADRSEIDLMLNEILQEMEPAQTDEEEAIQTQCTYCNKRYQARASYIQRKVKCKACRRQFVVQPVAAAEPEAENKTQEDSQELLLDEEAILLRNTRLWHCMSLIACWFLREQRSGLSQEERARLQKRLDRVKQIDREMGDPRLIGGLIDYYFAQTDEERKRGREQIEQAVERDVHVPEVLQLLDRENKLAQLSEYSLTYFHQLSQHYAHNSEVEAELRERFVRRMNQHRRFVELGKLQYESDGESVAPSLENLQGRGRLLQNRVSNIVRYRLSDVEDEVREDIQRQLEELRTRSDSLNQEVKSFQQSELGLMESTGEFLFRDEEEEEERDDDEKDKG